MPSQFAGHARPADSAEPLLKIRLARDASRAGIRTLFSLYREAREFAASRYGKYF
jgi:hypothetical protein